MQIRMDKENRELKAHGSYEFPVNISYEQLSRYERGSFSWHWHPEIELTPGRKKKLKIGIDKKGSLC